MDDNNNSVGAIPDNNKSPSVAINLTDAFKYIDAAAAGIGTGMAKVIKSLPPQSRGSTTPQWGVITY